MSNLSTSPANTSQEMPQVPSQRQRQKSTQGTPRILQWWYGIASPPEPSRSASLEERELFRRGRTGSQITFFLYIMLFMSYQSAFKGSNPILIYLITLDLLILIAATALNRFGKITIAGILVVITVITTPTINILTSPGGLNTAALPIFGLLVLPLMCVVSYLPAWWVFVVAIGNCIFTVCVLLFMPNSGDLTYILKVAFPGILIPIILSQIIVSIVAFLWVHGATQAIRRADRAEEIAALEALEIKRKEEQLAIGKQIEEGIQQIITTINSVVTRSDFSIRVAMNQENILWRAGRSINNLLSRLQGFRQAQEELKITHAIAIEVAQRMRDGQPIRLTSWTGTALDPIIMEYNKQFQNNIPASLGKNRLVFDRKEP